MTEAQQARLPRASGDGPDAQIEAALQAAAPPRERGWTRYGPKHPDRIPGSPARAGMDPQPDGSKKIIEGLPRASGDGPLGGPLAPL